MNIFEYLQSCPDSDYEAKNYLRSFGLEQYFWKKHISEILDYIECRPKPETMELIPEPDDCTFL